MARELTEQELQIISEAQAAIRLRGIHIDDTEEGRKNAALIMKPFEDSNAPVTLDGILSVVNQLADSLLYTSKTAKQLASSQLTAEEMDNLQDFLRRKPLVKLDGSENGFHNAVLLVEWLRRYKFVIDFNGLQKAMEGFAYSQSTDQKQLLRWIEPTHTNPRGRWSQDDDPNRKPGQLFTDERSNEWKTASGRKNHAKDTENQPKPVVPVLDASEAQWKRMAAAALGSGPQHHSSKAERQEAYDNALGGSYRAVYEAVAKVVRRQQMVRS